MRIRTLSLILLILFAMQGLAGCASVSTQSEELSTAAKNFDPLDDRGVVFMYRRGRMVGASAATMVKVNGIDAGATGPGTFFRWELLPGTYTFLVSTTESSATVVLEVAAGDVHYLEQMQRIGLDSGRVSMYERDAATAELEIEMSNLLISAYRPESASCVSRPP